MDIFKIVSAFYFLGGLAAASLTVAFLFEEVKKISLSVVLLSFLLSWASFGCYFWINSGSVGESNFWGGTFIFGFSLLPVAFYSWTVFIIGKQRRAIIYFGYLVSLMLAFCSFLNFTADSFLSSYWLDYYSKVHFLYPICMLMVYFSFFIASFIELVIVIFDKKNKINKSRYWKILILMAIIFFLGISNFPLWYKIIIVPIGGLLAIFSAIALVVYGVLRFHLITRRTFYVQFLIGMILSVNFIEIIFARSITEVIYKVAVMIFIMFFASLLMKNYKEDILQKEDLQKIGRKLKASNKKLKELDNAKNEFLSIVAHQLRTPPTVIKGYLNLAQEDPNNKLDAETKDSLSRALSSNDRLIELVDDVLNISRIESGKMQYDFQPSQSFEGVFKNLENDLKIKAESRKIRVKFQLDKNLPEVDMDTNKIREVFLNLIDNAIKYTDDGGEVNVKCFQKDDFVRTEVSDTGIGISKDEMKSLFKKFSRGGGVERLGVGGIGLGIYVGKKIVEAHNGKIWAESAGKGKGSTFIVEMPIKSNLLPNKTEEV